jgi:hypothetical protein
MTRSRTTTWLKSASALSRPALVAASRSPGATGALTGLRSAAWDRAIPPRLAAAKPPNMLMTNERLSKISLQYCWFFEPMIPTHPMSGHNGALTRSFDNGPFEKGFRDRFFEAP